MPRANVSSLRYFRILRFLFFLFSFLFAGCASAPKKQPFALGLYGVGTEALAEVKSAGFDVVTSDSDKRSLDALLKNGLKGLAASRILSPGWTEAEAAREIASRDSHPALWGWYICDEPDLQRVPPSKIHHATRFVQRRARKPGIITLNSGSSAPVYGQDCDLLFVDFYPVPWAPVSRFAKEMRLAALARRGRPYVAVVQAFDWTHFTNVLGIATGLRAPALEEIRCMAYMALAQQASGIFFFSYESGTWRIADSPLWDGLKRLVPELRARQPIFAGKRAWWPAEVEYGDPNRMYNEVHDAAMTIQLYQVTEEARDLRAGYYFVLINTTPAPVRFKFKAPFSGCDSLRDLETGEGIPLASGWLERTYEPFEVRFFSVGKEAVLLEQWRE